MNPDKIPETPAGRKTRLFLEAQARKRGRIEGEAKGKREALLALLKTRGLPVSAEQRAAVRGCVDTAKLDQWIVRAVTASSTSEVLQPAARSTAPRASRSRAAGARPRAARGT